MHEHGEGAALAGRPSAYPADHLLVAPGYGRHAVRRSDLDLGHDVHARELRDDSLSLSTSRRSTGEASRASAASCSTWPFVLGPVQVWSTASELAADLRLADATGPAHAASRARGVIICNLGIGPSCRTAHRPTFGLET